MSCCDRITDLQLAAVARVLMTWGSALDAAGMLPQGMVSTPDLRISQWLCDQFRTESRPCVPENKENK